jgi:hypothetical protein
VDGRRLVVVLAVTVLAFAVLASAACAPDHDLETRIGAVSATDGASPPNLDLLFVIDNSPGMAPMQAKLVDQIPSMMKGLNGIPAGSPSVHIAVISTDMGAHSDHPETTGCSEMGDDGAFQYQPRGTCTDTTLLGDKTYLATGVGGTFDGATVSSLAGIVQCILPLGESGCQYVHPLAAVARALGADGAQAPASNAGFLRPDATLAIVILSNQDDCSSANPGQTGLYSYNSGPDNLINSLGPLTTYRCNEFGHLCKNPHSPDMLQVPPESSTQGEGSPPTLDLTECTTNPAGLLTTVQTFVDGIRALKPDPDRQIVVGLVAAPTAPYTVAWVPASDPSAPAGQLWPEVEHSCGAAGSDDMNPNATDLATDGSFGDPSLRLTQFGGMFGANGVSGSVCSSDYATTMGSLTALLVSKLSEPSPITGTAGTSGSGSGAGAGGASAASDGGVDPTGGSGGHGPSGAAGSSGGGGLNVEPTGFGGVGGGLHSGCVCSAGAASPAGSALALLPIVPAIVRRRSRHARKKLT